MKFKLPNVVNILYPILVISIVLITFLPIANGELLNLSESIWIWGSSVTLNTSTLETISSTYDALSGFQQQ